MATVSFQHASLANPQLSPKDVKALQELRNNVNGRGEEINQLCLPLSILLVWPFMPDHHFQIFCHYWMLDKYWPMSGNILCYKRDDSLLPGKVLNSGGLISLPNQRQMPEYEYLLYEKHQGPIGPMVPQAPWCFHVTWGLLASSLKIRAVIFMGRSSLTQNQGEEERMTWQQRWIIRTSWSTAADTLERG